MEFVAEGGVALIIVVIWLIIGANDTFLNETSWDADARWTACAESETHHATAENRQVLTNRRSSVLETYTILSKLKRRFLSGSELESPC
jgi:hypothetical protein